MKRAVLYIFLFLAFPASGQGNIAPVTVSHVPELSAPAWDGFRLEYSGRWMAEQFGVRGLELKSSGRAEALKRRSLREAWSQVALLEKECPKDMVSMMSFVWAEMFGGVDVVAEVKKFARRVKNRGRYTRPGYSRKVHPRRRWRFTFVCRIDEQTEVAASLRNSGRFFRDGNLAFEVSTLDPASEEIGLRLQYSGGELDLRADRMSLTDRAAAKLELRF